MQTAVRPQAKTATINGTQSLTLMKKMVLAGVSEICYLRSLFPDDSFDEVMLGDNRVHMLRAPEDADSGVGILRRSLESAFEALELRYLRSMSLAIFSGPEDDPDRKLFEAFNFIFKYPDDQTIQATLVQEGRDSTPAMIRMQGNSLLKLLFALCSNMAPLPPSPVLEIKLFYREEVTPADYNPRHYSDATNDNHLFFEDQPTKVPLGRLVTPHHTMSLLAAFVPAPAVDDQVAAEEDPFAAAIAAEEEAVASTPSSPTTDAKDEGEAPVPLCSPLKAFLTLPATFPSKGVNAVTYLIARAALATVAASSSEEPLSLTAIRACIGSYDGPAPLAALTPGEADSEEDEAALWHSYIAPLSDKAGAGVTAEQTKRLVAALVDEGLLRQAGGKGRLSWTLAPALAQYAPCAWAANMPLAGTKRAAEAVEVETEEEEGESEVAEAPAPPPPAKRSRMADPTPAPAPAPALVARRTAATAVVAVPAPPSAPVRADVVAPRKASKSAATAAAQPLGGSGAASAVLASKDVPLLPVTPALGLSTGWATAAAGGARSVWGQYASLPRPVNAGGSASGFARSSGTGGANYAISAATAAVDPFGIGPAVSVPAPAASAKGKGTAFSTLSSVAALTAAAPRRPVSAPATVVASTPTVTAGRPIVMAAPRSSVTERPVTAAGGPGAGENRPAGAPRKAAPAAAAPRQRMTSSSAGATAAKPRGRPLSVGASAAARLLDF